MPRGSHSVQDLVLVWECWLKFWEQQEAEDSLSYFFPLLLLSISGLLIGSNSLLLPPSLFPPTPLHRRLLDPWPPAPHSAGLCQNQTGSPNVGAAFFKYSCSVGGGEEAAQPDPLTDDVIASRKKLMKPSQANLHPQVLKLH